MLLTHISQAIGNTPLLKIDESVHGITNLELYCKLEFLNPFGSIKDRPASYFIQDMLADETKIKVIEASSGNTIKALGALAGTYGFGAHTITNRIKVQEQLDMLKILGVGVEQLPSKSECIDFGEKNNPVQMIEDRCAADPARYHTDQYRNPRNIAAHLENTAQEIIDDAGHMDYFFAGLGTTGSSGGITAALRSLSPELVSIGVVSEVHDFIPGIRTAEEMSEVGIFDKQIYDAFAGVEAVDAVERTIHLIRTTGMLCGPTTGAVFHGIVEYFTRHPLSTPTKTVFIACDRIENYYSYIKQRSPKIFHQHCGECLLRITREEEATYYSSIEPEILADSLGEYVLIDTRGTKSYQLGHITGSINIPYDSLTELIDQGKMLPDDKPIVLLCPLGKKTKRLCSFLNKWGYRAHNLSGGLQQRKRSGLPFVKFAQQSA